MQTASFRVRTRLVKSTVNDDNRYATRILLYNINNFLEHYTSQNNQSV